MFRFFFFFFLFFSSFSFAETIPATLTPTHPQPSGYYRVGVTGCPSVLKSSPSDCFKSEYPNGTVQSVTWTVSQSAFEVRGLPYSGGSQVYYFYRYNCPSGSVISYDSVNVTYCNGTNSYVCPTGQNWTLSGSTCTRPDCLSGQGRDPNNGLCYQQCVSGSTVNSNKVFAGPGDIPPSTICYLGCFYDSSFCIGAEVIGWTCWTRQMTGQSCSVNKLSSDNTRPPSSSPEGSPLNPNTPGYDCVSRGKSIASVNGATVCVDPVYSRSTESGSTQSNNPSKTPNTRDSETTTCRDGVCTTIRDYDNGPGTTPYRDITEQPQSDFCTQNPNNPICKDSDSSFGGSCDAGPSCDGDAVQCAQAAEAYRIHCLLDKEPEGQAYLLGKSISEGGADPVRSPVDSSQVQNVDLLSIVTSAAAQRRIGGQCLSDRTFTAMGHSFTIPTTLLCSFAAIVGWLMVAAASVIAIRIVSSSAT